MKEILEEIYAILISLCTNSTNYSEYLSDRMIELRQMINGFSEEELTKSEKQFIREMTWRNKNVTQKEKT